MQDKKVSIIDLLVILSERKRFFIICMTLISVTAVIISLLLPKYYTSNACLLPSSSTSTIGNPLSALLGDLPLNNMMESFDFLSGSDNDQLLAILESRRLAEKVIARFDLATRYKFKKKKQYFLEDVLRQFNKNYDVSENDLKNITIGFTDSNPEFSAQVVNYIIEALDSMNSEVSRNNAKNTRLFFENRLSIVKHDMDSAHQRFAAFQEKHNYLDLEQQVISSIEALSKVEAQILSNDINMDFLKNRYGSGSNEVAELLKNRRILEKRMAFYMDSGSGELILPLKNTPKLSIEYSYLLRDVKVQGMLHSFLLQNYEQAKLSEANNTPSVNVLEYANIPQKKSQPKRGIICMVSFCIGLIIVSFLIFLMKWYDIQREQATAAYEKITMIKAYLKKW